MNDDVLSVCSFCSIGLPDALLLLKYDSKKFMSTVNLKYSFLLNRDTLELLVLFSGCQTSAEMRDVTALNCSPPG